MEWYGRLVRESIGSDDEQSSLLYHAALRPAAPPEYVVPGMVGLTFRLHRREDGRFVFATLIDLPAAIRLGERLGLDLARSVAFVDSHERVHVHLQLEGVPEEVEEEHSRFVDAVWLSLDDPLAEALVRAGGFGLVEEVGPGFWERLVDATQDPRACGHARTRLLAEEGPPSTSGERTAIVECLACGQHLAVHASGSGDGRGHAEVLLPREEALARVRRVREQA